MALDADRVRIAANGRDLALVTVQVLDTRERAVPDAADEMELTLDGTVRLLGTGNGDPTDTAPDYASRRRLFNGLMQAIVQSTGAAAARR